MILNIFVVGELYQRVYEGNEDSQLT